ncbi:MAG: tetratricopeptide repeat protein [Ignavibacteriae bacterium]|nr:tetratricopeptide repeat protein [Ignavibacteriota bacterium]
MLKVKYLISFFLLFSISIFGQDKNVENQIRLAKSFEEINNFDEAKKIYEDLLIQEPQNFIFYKNLHDLLIKIKNYDECKNLIENQILLNSQNIDLYGDLGSLYYLTGKEKDAFETWEKGISLNSENAFSYRIIANYLIENRLIEKSIEYLEIGNSKSEDQTIFSYDIANLYSVTMKFEKAAEEYCKIIVSKPNQIAIVKNRILGYINSTGAEEPTLRIIENHYDNYESQQFLELLIDLYLKTNNFAKVFENAIKFEKENTHNGSYLFNIATRISRLGNHEIAANSYKYILENYPQSPLIPQTEISLTREIEFNLKNSLSAKDSWKKYNNYKFEQKEVENLISSYENLTKKYPKDNVGIEAEFRSGIIYQEFLGNYKKADSIFQNIISENKGNVIIPEVKFRLAKLKLQNDSLNAAENILNEILLFKINDQNLQKEIKFLLAKTKMWKGEFSKAILQFNEVKENSEDENTNDALQLLLLLNTFKNDSINLFSYVNADYLIEKEKYYDASIEFKKLAENKNLILLKDFASVNYAELLLSLNNYEEAVIFLEEISNCDEDNIYKDKIFYLLGSTYYYGLNKTENALKIFARIFNEFPNSIYSGKSRKIISEINDGGKGNI